MSKVKTSWCLRRFTTKSWRTHTCWRTQNTYAGEHTVKYTVGASPGKAILQCLWVPRVCFKNPWGSYTNQQKVLHCHAASSTQSPPSTGTEGMCSVGVILGVRIPQGALSEGPSRHQGFITALEVPLIQGWLLTGAGSWLSKGCAPRGGEGGQ